MAGFSPLASWCLRGKGGVVLDAYGALSGRWRRNAHVYPDDFPLYRCQSRNSLAAPSNSSRGLEGGVQHVLTFDTVHHRVRGSNSNPSANQPAEAASVSPPLLSIAVCCSARMPPRPTWAVAIPRQRAAVVRQCSLRPAAGRSRASASCRVLVSSPGVRARRCRCNRSGSPRRRHGTGRQGPCRP